MMRKEVRWEWLESVGVVSGGGSVYSDCFEKLSCGGEEGELEGDVF